MSVLVLGTPRGDMTARILRGASASLLLYRPRPSRIPIFEAPNNPRVRRAPRLAFLPSPRRSLRAVMALRGQITTSRPERCRRAQFWCSFLR